MTDTPKEIIVPIAMQNLLSRLFGDSSEKALAKSFKAAKDRKVLSRVIDELYAYFQENIQTDELHRLMLLSGLVCAKESLKDENFYLGYIEGIVRFSLLLMGDHPDHRRRKGGRKNSDHYKLNLFRSALFVQDPEQKFRTILAVGSTGFPQLTTNPRLALDDFRNQHGTRATHQEFLEWYRKNYPKDYATIF